MAKAQLGIDEILELLPHRYPILLIDRVLEVGEGMAVAEKLVSANEPFLQGHFPGRPIMPGVLIVEAMAQTSALCICYNEPRARERGLVLAGISKARFRRPVLPGDVLTVRIEQKRRRGDLFVVDGVAQVEGELAAEAELIASVVDWDTIG